MGWVNPSWAPRLWVMRYVKKVNIPDFTYKFTVEMLQLKTFIQQELFYNSFKIQASSLIKR